MKDLGEKCVTLARAAFDLGRAERHLLFMARTGRLKLVGHGPRMFVPESEVARIQLEDAERARLAKD